MFSPEVAHSNPGAFSQLKLHRTEAQKKQIFRKRDNALQMEECCV
jgi:hypothetical protein